MYMYLTLLLQVLLQPDDGNILGDNTRIFPVVINLDIDYG